MVAYTINLSILKTHLGYLFKYRAVINRFLIAFGKTRAQSLGNR